MTRFLKEPTRVQLCDSDNRSGSFPTVSRLGDKRTGRFESKFDDTDTVVFYTQEQSEADTNKYINYPEGLPASSKYVVGRTDITGSITAPGIQRPGIGSSLISLTSSVQGPGPFVENFLLEQDGDGDSFYMTGTSPNAFPGFSSPLKSKTSIRLDLTTAREHIITRNPPRNNTIDPGGSMLNQTRSGFSYFNFSKNRWEHKGLVDPATGQSVLFDYGVEVSELAEPDDDFATVVSGTSLWCQQFVAPDMEIYASESERLTETNLKHVARPTVTMQAPFANRYHATASQVLKMSNYIDRPFLFEKAVVVFGSSEKPVNVQRINYWQHPAAASNRQSAERYQDDYVFFIYRQERANEIRDSKADVTGSNRYLLCSASMCFYNSKIKSTSSISAAIEDYAPLHTPNFSYDFGLSASPAFQVGQFTGSIRLTMKPQTLGPSLTGWFRVTSSLVSPAAETDTFNTPIWNFWPGGTTAKPFLSADFTGKEQAPGVFVNFGGDYVYSNYDGKDLKRTQERMGVFDFDGRAFSPMGKGGIKFKNENTAPIADSPYILLPEDELVFGIDALLGLRANQNLNEITGSYFKFPDNTPCYITLYGSVVRDGKEHHDTLNQNLTSDAVHEAIYSSPVIDQFKVEPRSAYSGTYTDNIFTGSATLTGETRGVVGSVVSGTFPSTGSSNAFYSFNDNSSIFFDSIPPSVREYVIRSGGIKVTFTGSAGYLGDNAYLLDPRVDKSGSFTRKFRESNTDGEDAGFRMPFPYVGNPSRVLEDNAVLLIVNKSSGLIRYDKQLTGEILKDVLFKRGQKRKEPNGVDIKHAHITGSQGYRYGMISNKPIYAKSIWNRDSYGQFRDMLEQRPYTVFFNETIQRTKFGNARGKGQAPVEARFYSGSTQIPANSASISSNISRECTSSIPYFDNTARN